MKSIFFEISSNRRCKNILENKEKIFLTKVIEIQKLQNKVIMFIFEFEGKIIFFFDREGVCLDCFTKRFFSNPPSPITREAAYYFYHYALDTVIEAKLPISLVSLVVDTAETILADKGIDRGTFVINESYGTLDFANHIPIHGCEVCNENTIFGIDRFVKNLKKEFEAGVYISE